MGLSLHTASGRKWRPHALRMLSLAAVCGINGYGRRHGMVRPALCWSLGRFRWARDVLCAARISLTAHDRVSAPPLCAKHKSHRAKSPTSSRQSSLKSPFLHQHSFSIPTSRHHGRLPQSRTCHCRRRRSRRQRCDRCHLGRPRPRLQPTHRDAGRRRHPPVYLRWPSQRHPKHVQRPLHERQWLRLWNVRIAATLRYIFRHCG